MPMQNALYYGDNLDVLRDSIASESVGLVYLDPPFNSQATYNLLFRSAAGIGSQAQIEAFEDTWHWGQEAEKEFNQILQYGNTKAADLLRAFRNVLGENDMMAYLVMLTARLLELHRVLKPSGSLYLHCDPSASHYIKLVLDGIFGRENFKNELIWQRSHAHSDGKQGAKHYGRVSDTILFYVKGDSYTFNPQFVAYDQAYVDRDYRHSDPDGRRWRLDNLQGPGGAENGNPVYEVMGVLRAWRYKESVMRELEAKGRIVQLKPGLVPQYKRYLDEGKGVPLQNIWTDMPGINNRSAEFLGYPTQKPVSLMERILATSSNPGDVVLDPFCGCGTTIHAAQKLGRAWIGIDITHLAISLIERRLKDAFPGIAFDVHGTPQDLDGARDLASRDKYQFQWWAVSLIDAQPFGGKKKGADGGIDGLIYFRSDAKTTERAIVSVKGGGVSVPMVRDLKGVLDREKAPIGVFLTLEPPTRPMEKEAASAGFYTLGERQYPRVQIITIEQALRMRYKITASFPGFRGLMV
jgi:adenine specific DNA methylase Mod